MEVIFFHSCIVHLCASKFLTEKCHSYSILHYARPKLICSHLHLCKLCNVCYDLNMLSKHSMPIIVSFLKAVSIPGVDLIFALFFNLERSVRGLRTCARLVHNAQVFVEIDCSNEASKRCGITRPVHLEYGFYFLFQGFSPLCVNQ